MATDYPVLRWQIGDVRITRVVESEGPTPGSFLFADATPEKLLQHAWLQPHFMTGDGMLLVLHPRLRRRVAGQGARRGHLRGQRQAARSEELEPAQGPLPRRHGRGRLSARARRPRRLHPPARGPCRMEYAAGRGAMGADLPQCPLPHRPQGMGILERASRRRRQSHPGRLRAPGAGRGPRRPCRVRPRDHPGGPARTRPPATRPGTSACASAPKARRP